MPNLKVFFAFNSARCYITNRLAFTKGLTPVDNRNNGPALRLMRQDLLYLLRLIRALKTLVIQPPNPYIVVSFRNVRSMCITKFSLCVRKRFPARRIQPHTWQATFAQHVTLFYSDLVSIFHLFNKQNFSRRKVEVLMFQHKGEVITSVVVRRGKAIFTFIDMRLAVEDFRNFEAG